MRFIRVLVAVLALMAFPLRAFAQGDPRPTLMPTSSAVAPTPPPPPPTPTAAPVQTDKKEPTQKPTDGSMGGAPNQVFAEDWWGRTRPILELHGYFRTRSELFHNFSLGRHNTPNDSQNLWPHPLDDSYTDETGTPHNVSLCGSSATPGDPNKICKDSSEAFANMRWRINPELHISDNLRVIGQIDALDNVVLGSTPNSYAIKPAAINNGTGYASAGYNGYEPLAAFSTTQQPPTAGVNGFRNSIDVKRVWAEYMTPVGQVRFGRMPNQWGLGMLANGGDGYDSDWQSTTDRIMFLTGIKPLDIYFAGAWDFPNSGPTTQNAFSVNGGQPRNDCNMCNVNQWTLVAMRRKAPELQRLALANGDLVLNGGLFTVIRTQYLDFAPGQTPITANTSQVNNGLERRDAWAVIPDLWIQALFRKFRFEAEFATVIGAIGNTGQSVDLTKPVDIRMFGLVTQSEYLALDDKLHVTFDFGFASGNPWEDALNPGGSGLQPQLNNGRGPISTFRFHPDYRIDLIFWRNIMTRVQGAYYFRPGVAYDFLRSQNGQKIGGAANVIWSRASEFVQTPGHQRDLGIELDASLYFQAKDGSLNDDPTKTGGFFAVLQYGVFFPLGGLEYLPGQKTNVNSDWGLSSAQTVRLLLNVIY